MTYEVTVSNDPPICSTCGNPVSLRPNGTPRVWYADTDDRPIGSCCILAALNDADDNVEVVEMSLDELLRRMGVTYD